jgi:hypothetical protein
MDREFSYVSIYLNSFFSEQKNIDNTRLIFRGHADCTWNVVSSAGRRLSEDVKKRSKKNDNEVNVSQSDFIRYHVNLLSNARKHGYGGIAPNSKLNDLELLAEIQHFGGATCLTDFTTNFLTALWFATKKDNTKDVKGKVLWIDLLDDENFSKITYYNEFREGDNIRKFLTKLTNDFEPRKIKIEPCFWLWEPSKLNNRIIKQDSVFLFGLPAFAKESKVMKENTNKIKTKEIEIEIEHKEKIREELDILFGINAETIFFDFTGFSNNANSAEMSISESLLPKGDCLANAKECIKKQKYKQAISFLNQGLSCKFSTNDLCQSTSKPNCKFDEKNLMLELQFIYWKGVANQKQKKNEDALNYFNHVELKVKEEYEKCSDNKLKISYYNMLRDVLRNQTLIYYENKDYLMAYKKEDALYSKYCNLSMDTIRLIENKGVDSSYTLVELSIMNLDHSNFITSLIKASEHLKSDSNNLSVYDLQTLGLYKNTNGGIVLYCLNVVGSIIFGDENFKFNETDYFINIDNCMEDIIKRLLNKENIEKNNMDVLLEGYYYWDFSDLIEWIKDVGKTNDEPENKAIYYKKIKENSNLLTLIIKKCESAQEMILEHVYNKSSAIRMNNK